MKNDLEWDQITAMATAAYNYFPDMSAKESAFFLMNGRDPVNKLSSILNAPRRYLGDETGLPDLKVLKNTYQMVAQQLYNSRQCYVKANKYNKIPDHGILVGDLVLMKNHTAKSFEPKYKEDYHVVQMQGSFACFSGCAYCIVWHWGILRECTLGLYRVLCSISLNITKILACVVQVDAFIISL